MKNLFFAVFTSLFLVQFVFAQSAALTQTEYVKMLYALQKNPAGKAELIESVRKRGIAFTLTDGLRGLTRSKGGNDEELKRTLEEAERRRQNPAGAQLPNAKEAAELIEKTRQNTLTSVKEMPDFVVKQLIGRSIAYAGTKNWKRIDNLAIAVSYSEKDGEQYKVLAINGSLINAEKGSNYGGLDGATTGGEFVSNIEKIFDNNSKTEFEIIDRDIIRNRKTLIYQYKIDIENNKKGGVTYNKNESVPSGETGKIWIDEKSFRVLKIQYKLTDIPANFPIKSFEKTINYDWVEIGGEKYLLPIDSTPIFTALLDNTLLQTRNIIRFKDYQKFGTDVIILDDDTAPPPEEEKP